MPHEISRSADGVVRGHHEHGHHEMREFSIHSEVRKEVNKTSHMDFQRAGFGLFKTLVQRDPWETALKNRMAGHSFRKKS